MKRQTNSERGHYLPLMHVVLWQLKRNSWNLAKILYWLPIKGSKFEWFLIKGTAPPPLQPSPQSRPLCVTIPMESHEWIKRVKKGNSCCLPILYWTLPASLFNILYVLSKTAYGYVWPRSWHRSNESKLTSLKYQTNQNYCIFFNMIQLLCHQNKFHFHITG